MSVVATSPRFDSVRRPRLAAVAHCVAIATDDPPSFATLQAGLSCEGLLARALPGAGDPSARQGALDGCDALLLWVTRGLAGELPQLRELRGSAPQLPLLVACRGVRELDQVLALEMGADDVLDTTWSAPVVAARLRARWRALRGELREAIDDELHFGALSLARHQRRVVHAGRVVALTEGEFEVLWLLASRAGHALSRREILHRVRGIEDQPMDRSIDCRVYRIRAKLGDDDARGPRIRTVRHRGYVFLPTGW